MSVNKINRSEKLMYLMRKTRDFIEDQNFQFDKSKIPTISLENQMGAYSIFDLNFFIEKIDELTIECISKFNGEDLNNRMAIYQVILYSIIWFVKKREDIGYRLSKNWKVYKVKDSS